MKKISPLIAVFIVLLIGGSVIYGSANAPDKTDQEKTSIAGMWLNANSQIVLHADSRHKWKQSDVQVTKGISILRRKANSNVAMLWSMKSVAKGLEGGKSTKYQSKMVLQGIRGPVVGDLDSRARDIKGEDVKITGLHTSCSKVMMPNTSPSLMEL